MDNKIVGPVRLQTDESLDFERKKIDAASREEAKSIERTADATLLASRDKLDKSLLSDRAESDRSLHLSAEASRSVEEERRRVDERIASERKEVDAATQRERSEKAADAEGTLATERHQTDLSLSLERRQIDKAYDHSGDLLAQEQAAHAVTKEAVATRDEVLALVSHDLQDPLTIITLCSNEFLDSQRDEPLTKLEVQWVDTIRRHAASMSQLVTSVLDVEYIATGKLQIVATTCDMTTVVREMLQSFQILACRQGLTLTADLSDELVFAYADKERVQQVLANLISNALKYTPKAGSIVVRLAEIDAEIHVAVADTGPGIPADQRLKIFERYTQLRKQGRGGMGLGLFISKWMIEAQGGKIWVEGEDGEGSTFHFSLPSLSAWTGVAGDLRLPRVPLSLC